jgi:hypothetical protein
LWAELIVLSAFLRKEFFMFEIISNAVVSKVESVVPQALIDGIANAQDTVYYHIISF